MKKLLSFLSLSFFAFLFGWLFVYAAQGTNITAVYHLENANDSGPNGYDLTENNSPSYVSAKINNGGSTGTSNSTKYWNYGDATNHPHYALDTSWDGPWTVAGWYKILTNPTSGNSENFFEIIQGDSTTGGDSYMDYWDNSGTLTLEATRYSNGIPNVDDHLFYATNLGTSVFHHIVMEYDGTNILLYLDGAKVGTKASSHGSTCGACSYKNKYRFLLSSGNVKLSGVSDEVQVWNRALSDAEINLDYNANNGWAYPFNSTSTSPSVIKSQPVINFD